MSRSASSVTVNSSSANFYHFRNFIYDQVEAVDTPTFFGRLMVASSAATPSCWTTHHTFTTSQLPYYAWRSVWVSQITCSELAISEIPAILGDGMQSLSLCLHICNIQHDFSQWKKSALFEGVFKWNAVPNGISPLTKSHRQSFESALLVIVSQSKWHVLENILCLQKKVKTHYCLLYQQVFCLPFNKGTNNLEM